MGIPLWYLPGSRCVFLRPIRLSPLLIRRHGRGTIPIPTLPGTITLHGDTITMDGAPGHIGIPGIIPTAGTISTAIGIPGTTMIPGTIIPGTAPGTTLRGIMIPGITGPTTTMAITAGMVTAADTTTGCQTVLQG